MLAPYGGRARSAGHVRPELVKWLGSHSPELERMAAIEADYIVIGHSHAQIVQRVGRPLVINPGSVGQARDHSNGRRLSYAVLDTATDHVEIDDYELDQIAGLSGTGGIAER